MFGIGAGELVMILVAGLIIFGPSELPKVGRAIGKGLREFRKAQAALTATLDEVSIEPKKKSSPSAEKVSVEKKSDVDDKKISAEKISDSDDKKISAEKISDSNDKKISAEKISDSDDKKISVEKISELEEKNFSVDETPPRSALTVDDVINLAKQSPLHSETGATEIITEKNSATNLNIAKENGEV